MSSIYIHIPFCKRRCKYCDFYKELYRPEAEVYFDALGREMDHRRDYLRNDPMETIFFGGGTPSVFHPARLQSIIDKARSLWDVLPEAEITAEINPDDASDEYLEALRRTDINRLSFGVQSFIDRDLELLGRRHTAEQAIRAVQKARELGFDNISIDLMFGIPGQDTMEWEKNIMKALALGIDHVSAYMLTIEDDTPLANLIDAGLLEPVGEEVCEEQFLLTHNLLTDAGFEHYEVSNYARNPWKRSRHNSNYWCGERYLGLGPGAVSFNGKVRSSVVRDVDKYIEGAGTDSVYENEELSRHDRYNEYLMVSLRTSTGVQRDILTKRFGIDALLAFEFDAKRFVNGGLLVREGNEYKIPPAKMMLSDAIIRELFYEPEE